MHTDGGRTHSHAHRWEQDTFPFTQMGAGHIPMHINAGRKQIGGGEHNRPMAEEEVFALRGLKETEHTTVHFLQKALHILCRLGTECKMKVYGGMPSYRQLV